ncbi:Major Facilitator Superfamily (MFS) transporter [Polymorphum gilvum SL003B-26A1]|uniref:Major Facilitator Superfamily (MFS) transporter n=1 Tax=Polymorphum gilvum (strain LMG 25793 / CGMCC 1.9160 / SL003B-26A1) TaxID=991905 RepID=F2IZG5_POLGS|nr:MFS transporter [Polymorphum gilvum]ADZ68588.1 Major Facilitator Superfamily (MFS) transporter [Polymorphum gilvum SL003B-26A1]
MWSWLFFDWAAQPFFTLVTTFVFAPYFASALAATPAQGQALWGYASAAAGLAIAVLAPVLGAIADATGRRKPWILAFSVPFVLACAALWFAAPGSDGAIVLALAAFAVATLSVEFATVFTNAMMPDLVPRNRLGRLSGSGWALGYLGGLVSLVAVLGFLAANPATGRTLIGLAPAFGLDAALREGDRASGPLSAVWYVVFVLPLFLFVPDVPRRSALLPAVRAGLTRLARTAAEARRHRPVLLFLLANMIYKDGLVALFAFGGIYAAGQLGWGTIEIGSFGVLLTITGTAGAFLGGRLDDALGPRPVVIGALALLILCGLGLVSIDRDTVLFVVDVAPSAAPGLTGSTAEILFLLLGGLIGAVAGPLQSASRTLLIHLAPEGQTTQFFGLFALSGKLTSFLAPLTVGLVTAATASQAAGMSVILAFFLAGGALLLRVPRQA